MNFIFTWKYKTNSRTELQAYKLDLRVIFSWFGSKVAVSEIPDPRENIELVVDLGIQCRSYDLYLK